ncbi:TniQ protein [Salipiger abyssi]|uniref:TniQ protein n=1 Tax=Salipiger abyssi TaxID=1250539 RepID=A0A1P8UU75_9RHOB|nr:TniQ protein [Salipiger abyssi]
MKRLPLRVTCIPGETAASFASRLARRNGVRRLVTFCSDVGIDYSQLMNGAPAEIERLATLGGADHRILQFWSPRLMGDGWFELGCAHLKFTCLQRTNARVCPVCISEARQQRERASGIHLGLWQLESIRTCHLHGCLLEPLVSLGHGRDAFDIVRLLEGYLPPQPTYVDENERHLETWLAGRIGTGRGSGWFDDLPIHVATQTAENLGALMILGADAKRSEISARDWLRAGNAGYAVMRNGLDAILATLREIQSLTPIDARLHRHRFGLFYNWLRDRDEDPAFDIIRDSVREYIWSNFPVTEGSIILGVPTPEQRVHTPATAATRAGEILGMTLATLRLLRAQGLISHAPACPKGASYFDEGEVTGFLKKLNSLAKPGAKTPEDAVPFREAALQCQTSLAEVVACVLDNHLPLFASAPTEARFGDLSVSIRAIRQTTTIPADEALSLGEASLRLKTDTRTIRALLECGHIDHILPFSDAKHRRWRVVCARSVEHFRTNHVSLTELADSRNRDAANLSKELYRYGVRPLRIGDKCQRFFRWCDVI